MSPFSTTPQFLSKGTANAASTRKITLANSKSPRGFSLIEVLVSISIFAIALLGLAAGAASVMRANQTSLNTTIATNLAQDKLEGLKAMTFSALPSCPSYTTGGCSDTWSSSGLSFNRSWQIISNSPVAGVNQIDVIVTWTDYTTHTLTISSSVLQ